MTSDKCAAKENFEDVIAFLQDFGDEEINVLLREGSHCATYISLLSQLIAS